MLGEHQTESERSDEASGLVWRVGPEVASFDRWQRPSGRRKVWRPVELACDAELGQRGGLPLDIGWVTFELDDEGAAIPQNSAGGQEGVQSKLRGKRALRAAHHGAGRAASTSHRANALAERWDRGA